MSRPPRASHPTTLRLTLDCELTAVRPAADLARRFLAELGFSETELLDCELALVEACNNAVLHCQKDGHAQPVLLDLLVDPTALELHVRDHTPGFEWPQVSTLPDVDAESGRGLFLIRSVMDYAAYFRGQGENLLVLRKNRRPGS